MARRYGRPARHRIHETPSPRRATGIGSWTGPGPGCCGPCCAHVTKAVRQVVPTARFLAPRPGRGTDAAAGPSGRTVAGRRRGGIVGLRSRHRKRGSSGWSARAGATATSRRSCSSAPAPSTATYGRYSGSPASPRGPSWFALCLMAALRTRNFQDSSRFGVRAVRTADRAGPEHPPNPVVTSHRLSQTRRGPRDPTSMTREFVDSIAVPRSALFRWKHSTPHQI
jgi:hypothetical protein